MILLYFASQTRETVANLHFCESFRKQCKIRIVDEIKKS